MNNRIIIIGAGKHGSVTLEACRAAGYDVVGFLDPDHEAGSTVLDCPVLGGDGVLNDPELTRDVSFTIAITGSSVRQAIAQKLTDINAPLATIIHPSAIISPTADIAPGAMVLAGAIVNTCAKIGPHTIVNTGAILEHDVVLAGFCHIGPGAVLTGGVSCLERTFVGAGATITPYVNIGADVIVGAGATVVKHVPSGLTVVGTPAVAHQH